MLGNGAWPRVFQFCSAIQPGVLRLKRRDHWDHEFFVSASLEKPAVNLPLEQLAVRMTLTASIQLLTADLHRAESHQLASPLFCKRRLAAPNSPAVSWEMVRQRRIDKAVELVFD